MSELETGNWHASASARLLAGVVSMVVVAFIIQSLAAATRAQGASSRYPKMAAVDEYLMTQDAEVALARSAAPASISYDDALRKGGHFVAAQALESVSSATTVRLRSGKVSITDGPFAETNEQIGGFILIDAKDLNEAIRLASHIPAIRLGAVEVRPIKELEHSAVRQ